jgi:hypothetical protein
MRLSSPFNDDEYAITEKSTLQNNFFSDSFNPPIIIETRPSNEQETSTAYFPEQPLTKSVRFDDNIQNITPTNDDIEIEDIIPTFETITNHMETSFVNIDETDIKPFQTEDLPSPLNDKSSTI